MEEKVVVNAGGLELEGLFSGGPKAKAVVVTHPHPRTAATCSVRWWRLWPWHMAAADGPA